MDTFWIWIIAGVLFLVLFCGAGEMVGRSVGSAVEGVIRRFQSK